MNFMVKSLNDKRVTSKAGQSGTGQKRALIFLAVKSLQRNRNKPGQKQHFQKVRFSHLLNL